MRRALVAILLIAACSKPTPDAIASWSATLQLTAQEWLSNSVPSSFARATIEAASKEFDKADKDLKGLDDLKAAADDFKKAIDRNDRAAVAACARRFAQYKKEPQ